MIIVITAITLVNELDIDTLKALLFQLEFSLYSVASKNIFFTITK
jgi:hypothetical protein